MFSSDSRRSQQMKESTLSDVGRSDQNLVVARLTGSETVRPPRPLVDMAGMRLQGAPFCR